MKEYGSRETSQGQRALAALLEKLGLVPSTHSGQLMIYNFSCRRSNALFWLHTFTYKQKVKYDGEI